MEHTPVSRLNGDQKCHQVDLGDGHKLGQAIGSQVGLGGRVAGSQAGPIFGAGMADSSGRPGGRAIGSQVGPVG